MKCPKCDTDNPSDSKYCKECATRLHPEKESPAFRTLTIEEHPHVLSKGTLIAGRYKIIGLLGRRGMGGVYHAYDQRLKREIALKILPPEYSQDKTRLARFHREATAAAALNHPNICTIHEVGESEGKTFICMEYVEGKTLRELIRAQLSTVEPAFIKHQNAQVNLGGNPLRLSPFQWASGRPGRTHLEGNPESPRSEFYTFCC